jgi:hypothetical protein
MPASAFKRLVDHGYQERDKLADEALAEADWTVIRIWEHEPPELAANRIIRAVRGAADEGPIYPSRPGGQD